MNLQELSTRVSVRFGRNDQAGNIPAWINLGLQRINNVRVFRGWKTSSSILVESALLKRNLPANIRSLYAIRWSDGSKLKKMTFISLSEFESKFPLAEITPQYGEPNYYTRWGNEFWVYPVPTNGTFYIRWGKRPNIMSQSTDTPEIPYDELIIDMAVVVGAQELHYQGDVTTVFKSNAQERLVEAITAENDDNSEMDSRMKGFSLGDIQVEAQSVEVGLHGVE